MLPEAKASVDRDFDRFLNESWPERRELEVDAEILGEAIERNGAEGNRDAEGRAEGSRAEGSGAEANGADWEKAASRSRYALQPGGAAPTTRMSFSAVFRRLAPRVSM